MVVRDRDTRMTLSFLVKAKGATDDYVIKRLGAFLKEVGHIGNKIIIRSDQESAVNAVAEKLAASRVDAQTIMEHSPVRSSGSNGVIERAVKEVECHIRSMKSALDERLKTEIMGDSKILPWMIEFSAVLLNRYLVGKDGKSA